MGTLAQRWSMLHYVGKDQQEAVREDESEEGYKGNVERYIGTIRTPVGLVGPLLLHGDYAEGTFLVPMATTEAALVASYNRGAKAMTLSGGVKTIVVSEGIMRAPYFEFHTLAEARAFYNWIALQLEEGREGKEAENIARFVEQSASKGGHLKLLDIAPAYHGSAVMLVMKMTCGEAAGQNMATLASDGLIRFVEKYCPHQFVTCYNDAKGADGDKIATGQAFSPYFQRGKRVVAEISLPRRVVESVFRSTPEDMVRCHNAFMTGRRIGGDLNDNVMLSNGLTALFIALGQDPACVIESSTALLRMEVRREGTTESLYASLSCQNLLVGAVGGGTRLPGAKAGLQIVFGNPSVKIDESKRSAALAEVCASVCLAGELSVIAAMAVGDFVSAHRDLRAKL